MIAASRSAIGLRLAATAVSQSFTPTSTRSAISISFRGLDLWDVQIPAWACDLESVTAECSEMCAASEECHVAASCCEPAAKIPPSPADPRITILIFFRFLHIFLMPAKLAYRPARQRSCETSPPPAPARRTLDSRYSLARSRRRTSSGRSGLGATCAAAVRADRDWR
jgi:hypothetical protein